VELSFLRKDSSTFGGFLNIAKEQDVREFQEQIIEPTGSQVILREYQSILKEQDLPVLGPGGRISVFFTASAWLEADIGVRKRLRSVPSQWRQQSEIVQEILRQLSERTLEQNSVRISARLGYFELSKYEPQRWLRPAFVFLLEIVSAVEPGVAWRDTIIAPAATTTETEIALEDGFGSWTNTG
jgi:hypothetical protein